MPIWCSVGGRGAERRFGSGRPAPMAERVEGRPHVHSHPSVCLPIFSCAFPDSFSYEIGKHSSGVLAHFLSGGRLGSFSPAARADLNPLSSGVVHNWLLPEQSFRKWCRRLLAELVLGWLSARLAACPGHVLAWWPRMVTSRLVGAPWVHASCQHNRCVLLLGENKRPVGTHRSARCRGSPLHFLSQRRLWPPDTRCRQT